jgi:hypothetical protein
MNTKIVEMRKTQVFAVCLLLFLTVLPLKLWFSALENAGDTLVQIGQECNTWSRDGVGFVEFESRGCSYVQPNNVCR